MTDKTIGPLRQRLVDIFIGSSPRVRGTHDRDQEVVGPGRFIPACARNAAAARARYRSPAVHPRARGERTIGLLATAAAAGSSRVRGERL
jgi:hypothetical protein